MKFALFGIGLTLFIGLKYEETIYGSPPLRDLPWPAVGVLAVMSLDPGRNCLRERSTQKAAVLRMLGKRFSEVAQIPASSMRIRLEFEAFGQSESPIVEYAVAPR